MTVYGLYVRDLATADLIWFTTAKSFEPGAYLLGRHHGHSPNVYVAESIPALVLRVGPLIDEAEESAQLSLSTPDIGVTSEEEVYGVRALLYSKNHPPSHKPGGLAVALDPCF